MKEVDELAKEIFVNAMKGAEGLGTASDEELTELLEMVAQVSYKAAKVFYQQNDEGEVA